ncbi:hypothetical protein BWI15_03470 [Kribbella sp. ALI-6-A]|nr:hypothetical protein BWI15_03470 [Kribbella sp. ALI-6-A]
MLGRPGQTSKTGSRVEQTRGRSDHADRQPGPFRRRHHRGDCARRSPRRRPAGRARASLLDRRRRDDDRRLARHDRLRPRLVRRTTRDLVPDQQARHRRRSLHRPRPGRHPHRRPSPPPPHEPIQRPAHAVRRVLPSTRLTATCPWDIYVTDPIGNQKFVPKGAVDPADQPLTHRQQGP